MKVKFNPIIDVDVSDVATIRKAKRLCGDLIEMLAVHTITDDAHIACADNGEVFITEKELYAMFDVLDTMDRIFDEAPSTYDGSGHKVLAVEFVG